MNNYFARHIALFISLLALLAPSLVFSESSKQQYVINLASSVNKFTSHDIPSARISGRYKYFTVQGKTKGRTWYGLRLGLYATSAQASNDLRKINKYYTDAYVGLATVSDRAGIKNNPVSKKIYPAEYLLVQAADALFSVASKLNIPSLTQQDLPGYYYVVNLKTSNNLDEFNRMVNDKEIAKHALYISSFEVDGRQWYQYRLGFFVDKEKAEKLAKKMSGKFPLARVLRVTRDEKQQASSRIKAFFAAVKPETHIKPKDKHAKNADKVYKEIMARGTQALSVKDYKKAIHAFRELLSYPENYYTVDAQELLGFSYELNKQISNARQSYEQYISLYPSSQGIDRVRQRLASLITARKALPKALRKLKQEVAEPQWQMFGSVSQFYRRDISSLDIDTETTTTVIRTTDRRVNLSELDTILTMGANRKSQDYDIRTRFTGGHVHDFKDKVNNNNSGSINELYIDVLDIKTNLNGRIGRQNSNSGGVYGRFDGLDAGYQVYDWLKFNFTAGYLVPSVYHSAEKDNLFNSVQLDFGTFFNAWDFSLFYMKQEEGSITGREAVGTEFRYFKPGRSLFGLFDYDIMFEKTNSMLLNGTWTFDNQLSFNAALDFRQSPLLTARNALQGQAFQTVDEMLASFTEQQVLDIAMNRSARVKTYIAGMSYPLSEKYTFNTDITATKFFATQASAGVAALPETDTEYYVNSQLVGSGIYKKGDTSISGINLSETVLSRTLALRWNYRYPVSSSFRVNPRLSLAERDNKDGTSQSIYGASIKLSYRWKRRTTFEFEFSGETSDKTLITGKEDQDIYFLSLGYQHNF